MLLTRWRLEKEEAATRARALQFDQAGGGPATNGRPGSPPKSGSGAPAELSAEQQALLEEERRRIQVRANPMAQPISKPTRWPAPKESQGVSASLLNWVLCTRHPAVHQQVGNTPAALAGSQHASSFCRSEHRRDPPPRVHAGLVTERSVDAHASV